VVAHTSLKRGVNEGSSFVRGKIMIADLRFQTEFRGHGCGVRMYVIFICGSLRSAEGHFWAYTREKLLKGAESLNGMCKSPSDALD
jgi:hypothetical protein